MIEGTGRYQCEVGYVGRGLVRPGPGHCCYHEVFERAEPFLGLHLGMLVFKKAKPVFKTLTCILFETKLLCSIVCVRVRARAYARAYVVMLLEHVAVRACVLVSNANSHNLFT